MKEIETFGQLPKKKQKQGRFSVKNSEMVLEEIEKSKFSQIINKSYYFSDGIMSLPFSHSVLTDINKFKRENQQKTESVLLTEKHAVENGKICCSKKQNNFALQKYFTAENKILSP